MQVLIVEDEPLAQTELKRILASVAPHCEIMAVTDGIESSVRFLRSNKPNLIFMDIQLSDGQSFEIFSLVDVTCPVVFTTAYDAFALQAFKANGIDYLLKPIEPEAIVHALEKYNRLAVAPGPSLETEKLLALMKAGTHGYKTRFMTTIGDRIKFLNHEEIAYFQADDEVVYIITHEKKKYILNYTLEALDSMVDPTRFFRISRRYIVSIDSISDIHKHFNSRLKLQLQPDPAVEVLVSRARVQDFLQWIGQ